MFPILYMASRKMSFSAMRRIKTWKGSSMELTRFLFMLHIEWNIIIVENEKVLNIFLE